MCACMQYHIDLYQEHCLSICTNSWLPQKSTTLSKVGTIRQHCRPPSTQLKPLSIFLKGEFEAAHSRKVGIVSGDLPQNLHSTNVYSRPSHYPSKIRNVIKGRNNPATLPSAVNATKAYIHLFKRRICSGSQPPYSWSAKL